VPSLPEIHRFAGEFFDDLEVYEFIGEHIDYFDRLDLRLYFKAREVKATGVRTGQPEAWKQFVLCQMMDIDKRIALDLMCDESFASDNQRAKEYSRITEQSDRTFYRHRDEIKLRQEQAA